MLTTMLMVMEMYRHVKGKPLRHMLLQNVLPVCVGDGWHCCARQLQLQERTSIHNRPEERGYTSLQQAQGPTQ